MTFKMLLFKLTITVWNVVIPGAVCVAEECLDCKSIREPMSYQTGEGHATTCLIQPRRRIQNQRRRIAVTIWTFNITMVMVLFDRSYAYGLISRITWLFICFPCSTVLLLFQFFSVFGFQRSHLRSSLCSSSVTGSLDTSWLSAINKLKSALHSGSSVKSQQLTMHSPLTQSTSFTSFFRFRLSLT